MEGTDFEEATRDLHLRGDLALGGKTMSKQRPVSKPNISLLPTDVEGFDSLAELTLDMRWSWNHADDEVWRQLDPALWEFTQNPWVVLQTVSRKKLQRGEFRTANALRFPWKPHEFCGSDDPIDGRKDDEESGNEEGVIHETG